MHQRIRTIVMLLLAFFDILRTFPVKDFCYERTQIYNIEGIVILMGAAAHHLQIFDGFLCFFGTLSDFLKVKEATHSVMLFG